MSKQDTYKLNCAMFQETLSKLRKDRFLINAISESNKGQQIILESDNVIYNKNRFDEEANILVTKNSTFNAARGYDRRNKVCVLNFANSVIPGGGVKFGSSSQEECLCRCSSLYSNISRVDCVNKFYAPHKAKGNVLANDDIIYTPDVVVFRRDDGKILLKQDWKMVDVITCAAPNLGIPLFNIEMPKEELKSIHMQRGRRILEVAAANECNTIILGAFGCGAFANSPEVVADAYKTILPEFIHTFKNIEFAIFCKPGDEWNFTAFNNVISKIKN